MFDFDENLKYIILLFLLSSYIVYQSKIKLIFNDNNNKLKQFGLGPNKTILPFWLLLLLIASLIYIYIKCKYDNFM